MIQHESNNGLAINEQNGIPYATYIGKLLGATHAMRADILYATAMMAQEDWTGVKRILRYLKRTIDFALTCGGKGGIGNQSSLFRGVRRTRPSEQRRVGVNRVTWPTQKVICPESLPLAKHASLIKHALPTATTRLYINNLHNIVSY